MSLDVFKYPMTNLYFRKGMNHFGEDKKSVNDYNNHGVYAVMFLQN